MYYVSIVRNYTFGVLRGKKKSEILNSNFGVSVKRNKEK